MRLEEIVMADVIKQASNLPSLKCVNKSIRAALRSPRLLKRGPTSSSGACQTDMSKLRARDGNPEALTEGFTEDSRASSRRPRLVMEATRKQSTGCSMASRIPSPRRQGA